MKVNVKKFDHDGFLKLPQLFEPKEFEILREKVFESIKKRERGETETVDALADPLIEKYVYDGRILDVARQILGRDDITYFGDAGYAAFGHDYDKETATGWHRDNTDRSRMDKPDWDSRYTLIRFGLYLQDHHRTSGGIMFRKQSHNKITRGLKAHLYSRYLNNRMGDVGVWSMRTLHSGAGLCFKLMPSIAISHALKPHIPDFLVADMTSQKRTALWLTYGVRDGHLIRHCDYLMTRSERLKMWKNSYYSDETLAACKQAGLHVENMPERMRKAIKNGDEVGTHDHHYDFPG